MRVTVSDVESVQDITSFFWSEHEIKLRTATFAMACERILIARQERGLYR